jgi:hypothetical protein
MRRALPLLFVGLLASCTKHVAGETGSIQLALAVPAAAQPFAAADAVEVRIVDPGREAPFVASVPWPPTDQTPVEFLLTPDGLQWSLVVAARSGSSVIALGRSAPFDLAADQSVTVPVFVGLVGAFSGAVADASGTAPLALAQARSGHVALALPDGRVAVVGGASAGDPLAPTSWAPAVELLDPLGRDPAGTGLQPYKDVEAIPPRTLHGAVLTPDGTVVVVGGLDEQGQPLRDIWSLEPGQSPPALELPDAMTARAGAAVALIGPWPGAAAGADSGKLLVVGGCATTALTDCSADAWVVGYTNTKEGRKVAGFDVVRFGATATPLPGHGDVLVAGGRDEVGLASAVYLFDSHGSDAGSLGTMSPITAIRTRRERHVAITLPDGSVLLAGGLDSAGNPLKSAEVYVPWLGTAGRMLPAGDLVDARYDATAVAQADGSIVVVGGIGADGTTPAATVERFVPDGPNADGSAYGGTFARLTPRLPTGRAGAAAAVGPGGELIVSGGRSVAGALADLLILVQCLPDEGLSCQ